MFRTGSPILAMAAAELSWVMSIQNCCLDKEYTVVTDDTSVPKKEAFALFFGIFSGHLFDNPVLPCCLAAKLE